MKYLAVHIDTTGINYDGDDPSEGYEIVAICLMVCNEDFDILHTGTFYNASVDDGMLKASERYHGITSAVMEEVGLPEEEFVAEFVSFIVEHYMEEVDTPIKCLGHNVATFTIPFLQNRLLNKYELPIKFSSNVLDTYSVLVPTVGDITLGQMIGIFGEENDTDEYSSTCYKCRLFVNIFKRVKQIWKKKVLKEKVF